MSAWHHIKKYIKQKEYRQGLRCIYIVFQSTHQLFVVFEDTGNIMVE